MNRDGKHLEALVAFVERTLVPEGFKVTTNDRVYNDDGVQVAEFDVLVQGKVGTGEFQWLIECRDRPSSGAAPVAWIEQLVGRRVRFNFSKVTAVSTTGFAPGVAEFAQTQGIELREVRALTPEDFGDWLEVRYVETIIRGTTLMGARVFPVQETLLEQRDALIALLAKMTGDTPFLLSSSIGKLMTMAEAFAGVASENLDLFEGIIPNGEPKLVRVLNQYPDDDCYIVETTAGEVKITSIEFTGELRIDEVKFPIVYTGEYRNANTGAPITQVVTYAPQSVMGNMFAVEVHKFADTGETRVMLRNLPSDT